MRRALGGRRPSLANRGWRWPSRPSSFPISSAPYRSSHREHSSGAPPEARDSGDPTCARRRRGDLSLEQSSVELSRRPPHRLWSGPCLWPTELVGNALVDLARLPTRNGAARLQYRRKRAPAPLGRPGDFTRAETGHLGFTGRVRLGRLGEPSAYPGWREANPAPHPNDPATVGAHSYSPRADPPSICCGVASSGRPSRGFNQARRGTR